MEVTTKSNVEEIRIVLTPRDFSSVRSLIDLNDRINAIFKDMVPVQVQAKYEEWCKQQIAQQVEQCMSSNNREEKCEEKEADDGVVKAIEKGKYYNAVFQHIGWEHAQQLLTLAKQLNIEFGQIKPE